MIEWKKVVGYEKFYETSSEADVKSLRTGELLVPGWAGGYLRVRLKDKDGIKKHKAIHIIVALAFLGIPDPDPESGKPLIVDHINGDRKNNSLENLRWITQGENVKHAHKLNPNMNVSKRVLKLDLNNKVLAEYVSVTEASKANMLTVAHLSTIIRRKNPHQGLYYYRLAEKKDKIKLEKDEKFKNIGIFKGYDFSNYEVSNYGKVKHALSNKFRKISFNKAYPCITITSKDGKEFCVKVHLLVGHCFIVKPTDFLEKKYVINHIDQIKTNNYYKNLEWLTGRNNTIYSIGKSVNQIDKDTGVILNTFKCIADAYHFLGYADGKSGIGKCCRGDATTVYGYVWEFTK